MSTRRKKFYPLMLSASWETLYTSAVLASLAAGWNITCNVRVNSQDKNIISKCTIFEVDVYLYNEHWGNYIILIK